MLAFQNLTRPSGSSYTANFVDFDGVNDVVYEWADGLTVTGTKTCTFCLSFYIPTAMPGVAKPLIAARESSNERHELDIQSNDGMKIRFEVSAGSTCCEWSFGIVTKLSADTLYTVMGSFDTATSTQHLYVNGTIPTFDVETITADAVVANYTRMTFGSSNSGAGSLQFYMADVYYNFGEYLDLSSSTNRDKLLITADKGSDGSTVTGTQPDVFLSGPTSTWHTNLGTQTGFIEGGALTDAPSPPN